MPYSRDLYAKAERILEKRRDKAEFEKDIRVDEIKQKLPEIANIQKQLSEIGFEISQLFFFKGDVEAKVNELKEKSQALVLKRNTILLSNGYSENALQPEYICPACKDKGRIDGRMCNCQKKLLKELMYDEINELAPLESCTFDNFSLDYYSDMPDEDGIVPRQRAEKILEASRRYAQNFSKGSKNLLFLGSTGLGKTHLSLAIANVVIQRGYSVCYGTSHNICEDLRSEMFGRTERLRYTNSKLEEADLLIIDDLGCEVDNQYNIASIYNIINTRILEHKPTIISTNYDYDELLAKYDQRITSRLTGEYLQLCLIGSDIRNIK